MNCLNAFIKGWLIIQPVINLVHPDFWLVKGRALVDD